ncbi:MAG: 3-hydroxybutyrate oligomer hydrolase family protein [Pseudomonadota bacterium]
MRNEAKSSARPGTLAWELGPAQRESLLTARLALSDLQAPALPDDTPLGVAAVHKDFRDLVDVSAGGGFTRTYGPPEAALAVPGQEYTALMRLPGRAHAFTVRLLVPDAFDWDAPLLVAAPSSGSRGVTGAIGDIGAWVLPQGHALVLTDKGTGIGAHILASDTAYGPDLAPTNQASDPTTFRLNWTTELQDYSAANPFAAALKHAHSRENVEADWPRHVLEAIRFGLYTLRTQHAQGDDVPIKVFAAGVSNGGGASLRAAEADEDGLIDAVVVAEPNVTPKKAAAKQGLPLLDYATQMNLYLPAALLAKSLEDAPFADISALHGERYAHWARDLAQLGLLEGPDTQALAKAALRKIEDIGFSPTSFDLLHAMGMMQAWPTISYTYASAYGRFGVEEAFLGARTVFADANLLTLEAGSARAPTADERARLGATNSGLPPGGGLCLLYANGSMAQSIDDALALRTLTTGTSPEARRVQQGMAEVSAACRNSGIPTLIVHGTSDPLIAPRHSSQAYFRTAAAAGQDMTHWRLYEIPGAQHFETLLMFEDVASRYTPQLPHFFAALTACKAHVFDKQALPQTLMPSAWS